MNWMLICQWLIVAGWSLRLLGGIVRAVEGSEARAATGAGGVFFVLAWFAVAAAVAWKAGALTSIVGGP